MPQIDRSSDREYIEIDMGGSRFTHYPSGDTCLRHPWMRGKDAVKWIEKFQEFAARHPETHVAVNSRHEIIDDIRNYPYLGGGFQVGDLVVTRVRGMGHPDCVRRIVEARSNGDARFRDPGDVEQSFILDDGQLLYWSSGEDAWLTDDKTGRERSRARRPVEGDDLEWLTRPAGEVLSYAAMEVRKYLEEVWSKHQSGWGFRDRERHAELFDAIRAVVQGIDAHQPVFDRLMKAVEQDWLMPEGEELDAVAAPLAELLEKSVRVVEELRDLPEAGEIGLNTLRYGLDQIVDRGTWTVRTLRERGAIPAPEAAPAP